jgi:hypothetical protein
MHIIYMCTQINIHIYTNEFINKYIHIDMYVYEYTCIYTHYLYKYVIICICIHIDITEQMDITFVSYLYHHTGYCSF